MIHDRRFRSVVCVLLAVLTLIHTTPLYATQSQASNDNSTSTQVEQDTSISTDVATSATTTSIATITSNPLLSAPAQGPSTSLSTGAAAYTYPIETPPGRAGIGPKLALNYSSYNVIAGVESAGIWA